MDKDGLTLNKDYFMMHNIPLDGKGIELSWKVGAGCDGMAVQLCATSSGIDKHAYPDTPNIPFSGRITEASKYPCLYVDLNGKRFMDEGLFNRTYKANQVARLKNKQAYAILDSNIARKLEVEGVQDVDYMARETNTIENIQDIIEKNAALGTKCVIAADSIEELAQKCGIPVETMKKTVDEYNGYCNIGWDKEFGKNRRYLDPINSGRYYALLLRLEGYGTIGGIRINENAEAVTDNEDVIPGLYAAGDCANNAIAWDESIVYTLWGSTLGFSCNCGRFAGESAGDYVKTFAADDMEEYDIPESVLRVEKGYTEGKTVTVIETSKENPDYTIVMIDESYFALRDYDGEKWSDCRTVVRRGENGEFELGDVVGIFV